MKRKKCWMKWKHWETVPGSDTCWGHSVGQKVLLLLPRWCLCVNLCASLCLFQLRQGDIAYLLPCFSCAALSENVATWTRPDLSRRAEAGIFLALSIWTLLKSLSSFSFAKWERSSHCFFSFLRERERESERASSARRLVAGKSAGEQREGCVLMEIVAGWIWRPAGPHQPVTSLSAPLWQLRTGVAGPGLGGPERQMVLSGDGPRHSGLCSRGSSGAAKNRHGLLLLGTFRGFSFLDYHWEYF